MQLAMYHEGMWKGWQVLGELVVVVVGQWHRQVGERR